MEKLTISVPVGNISTKDTIQLFEHMNNEYDNKYNFIVSEDEEYHFEKYNDNRFAFIIYLNTKKYDSRSKNQDAIYKKLELLNIKDIEMLFVVSDKDEVFSLSNNQDTLNIKNIIESEEFNKI